MLAEMSTFTRSGTIVGGAFLLLAVACSPAPAGEDTAEAPATPAAAPWSVALAPLPIPASGQTAQPQLTVSDHGVILSWLENEALTATLKFAEYASGSWSPERTVASSDEWFISPADVPTVQRMGNGTVVATTYPAIDPAIEAYDVRLLYSRDDGKTWSKPFSPHHDGTKTQHGFASPFEMPDGGLGLVWLDGRAGDMSMYFGAFDASWKQTAETAVDSRACECCQTAVAVTADGPLVAFRDRSPREIRDIHASLFSAGTWTQPRPVHVDNWRIEACPVNGPALSARGADVAVAWFTALDDAGKAFAAFSQDSGRTWGTPIRLDDGASLGHVDVEMLEDGSAVASWVEFADQRSQFRMRRITPSLARSEPVVIAGASGGRVTGYPRLAGHGHELLLAWSEREESGISQQVKAAIARTPALAVAHK
jgi:hypothetical protein